MWFSVLGVDGVVSGSSLLWLFIVFVFRFRVEVLLVSCRDVVVDVFYSEHGVDERVYCYAAPCVGVDQVAL